MPPVVETLLDVAQVRVLANQLGVSLVTYKRGGFLVMKLNAEYMPDQAAFIPAMAMTDKRLMPSPPHRMCCCWLTRRLANTRCCPKR